MVFAHSVGRIILLKSLMQKPYTIQPVLSGRNALFPVLLVHMPRGNLGTSSLHTPGTYGPGDAQDIHSPQTVLHVTRLQLWDDVA